MRSTVTTALPALSLTALDDVRNVRKLPIPGSETTCEYTLLAEGWCEASPL